jgi:immune inhibitor A
MNRKIILLALIAIFCQMAFLPVYAVKAYPFPINISQPDGTQLTILLHGDEFHHYQTTEDGYLLKENIKGYLTYALVDAKGKAIESSFIARNINNRSGAEKLFLKSTLKAVQMPGIQRSLSVLQKSRMLAPASTIQRVFPKTGSPRSLVILVNFSDTSFVTPDPQTAFTNLLNEPDYSVNGGTGSAKDYFQACSYGKFSPTFDVFGPVTLPNPMAYYGANDASGNDVKAEYMIADACTAAHNTGLDFRQYDTDNDGVIDNVFVYYAGHNEAEGGSKNSIWPHRWSMSASGYSGNVIFDGKTLDDYACTSELRGKSGSNMCGIGTFCHEFGHVLGLPDYYDTNGAQAHTLDSWDIMDYGAYNNIGRTPPTYSVYDRFFLGYLTPQQVSAASDLTLLPIYQGKTQPANMSKQAYLFSATTHNLNGASPNPAEFFMVEYRKQTGWDTFLPAEGMCIWHIDYDQSIWDINTPNNYTGSSQTANSHMRVYLQPLSGSAITPGTAFTSGSFTPRTWAGTDINRPLTSIMKTADSITFKLMGGAVVPTVYIGKVDNLLQFPATKVNIGNTKTINIKTTDITSSLTVSLSGPDASLFTVSVSSLSQTAANAPTGSSITINYKPTVTGNHTATLTISGGGLNPDKVITLQGSGI